MVVETRADLCRPNPILARRGSVRAVRLTMLDGFELTSDDRPMVLPLNSQRLIALLALHERPLLRLHVAGVLWPDTSEPRSAANLRTTLWRLHRPGLKVVEATGLYLRLSPSVSVDVREMTVVARRLLESSADCEAADCTRLYLAGELLRDWYDDWVIMERERFRHLRLHALERLCAALTSAGRFGQAVQAGVAALNDEPLRESACRVLIRAHLAEGNRVEALRQYNRYRQNLWNEVKLRPSAELEALVHTP